ncbi:DUF3826 domain-containing protein [Aeoliella sp. ICT_H6.2]|uniref:DUF3826 domain-containing protein n=1 Tax=Aeoliella straminimaris TaxID=2954799 RepID=A0A9X2FDV8_9BACT|nr:DUF3826 domain-containing protein [Aeoliella straminimaris]MCO6046252.1 DUF3826 domain-containing protein [Aeoliella straminimaris]
MRRYWLLLLPLLLNPATRASGETEGDAAYRQAIHRRAERIVEPLEISDPQQRDRVVDLIAGQYYKLQEIHAVRDHLLEAAAEDKTAALDAYQRQVVTQHRTFCAQLLAELDPQRLEQVKDGMTYGVVPHTYNAYSQLLPDLTEEQKRFIRFNLLEAREYAMDAGSAEEKHALFGKYKGRINNYLSQAGYDLKQAEHDLAERTKKKASHDEDQN